MERIRWMKRSYSVLAVILIAVGVFSACETTNRVYCNLQDIGSAVSCLWDH